MISGRRLGHRGRIAGRKRVFERLIQIGLDFVFRRLSFGFAGHSNAPDSPISASAFDFRWATRIRLPIDDIQRAEPAIKAFATNAASISGEAPDSEEQRISEPGNNQVFVVSDDHNASALCPCYVNHGSGHRTNRGR
jgi:hypothetical protein